MPCRRPSTRPRRTSSRRSGPGPRPRGPPADTGSRSPSPAGAPRARCGPGPAAGPRPRSARGIGRGPQCRDGGRTPRGSRARLQGVPDRVVLDLFLRDLLDGRDRDVLPRHAMLAAEDRQELLAGRRVVLRGEFLRERLPGAPHAEAAADSKRLHGTSSQGTRLLKNLLGSAGLGEGGAEMLEQIVGELPRDALDGHQVLRGRLREIFRGLEPGIGQGLRTRLADSLDAEEFLVDAGVVYLRRLELEDAPLDPFVPGAALERLRVRAEGIVVAAHLDPHVSLRGPRLLVVGIELGEMIERVQGGFAVAFS